jgi:hypothetical protein
MRCVNSEHRHQEVKTAGPLLLRGRADALEATNSHVAVHVGAGADGTVAACSDLVGCRVSLSRCCLPFTGRGVRAGREGLMLKG